MHLTQQEVATFQRDGCIFPFRVLSTERAAHYRGCLEEHEAIAGQPLQGNLRHKTHLLFRWADELVHNDEILDLSIAPANVPAKVEQRAIEIARGVLEALDVVGVLTVEFFVTRSGDLMINELAPRVHNSGHWTIEGAATSQFEQHIRAIAGWPLAKPERRGRIEMINLIGEEVEEYARWLAEPHAKVHLYGKAHIRAGRRHTSALAERFEQGVFIQVEEEIVIAVELLPQRALQ